MNTLSGSVSEFLPDPETHAGHVPRTMARGERTQVDRRHATVPTPTSPTGENDESTFLELRRKVQSGELLSASTEKLLRKMKFNGHLTVMIQHGTVVKSGYEEGYFRRKNDLGGAILKT